MSNSPFEHLVTYELSGTVALIGLNRVEKRNAISEEVIDQLRNAVLRAHEEANVAVLFGHGSNFSAGLDLAEALKRATGEIKPSRKRRRQTGMKCLIKLREDQFHLWQPFMAR